VLGQVTEVETLTVANNMSYAPFGPLTGLTFGNGLVLSRTLDQQYRLTDQTTGTIQDIDFTLDAAGNVDAITDWVNTSLSQGFSQDVLDRIDWESGDYGTKSYSYDAAGNRLSRTHGLVTQTLTYTSSSNRLATHDGNAVTLDAAGNTTSDVAQNLSFGYGDHNRMLEAYVGGVLQATYVYNGQGQRVKKVEATWQFRTFVYHYGLSGELLGETVYDQYGARIGETDYLWLETLPVAQSQREFSGSTITDDTFVYLHADQLETPRLATDGSGTVVWRWDSDAFGIGAADEDPDLDTNLVTVSLRFPGQYFDAETGLHYNYFRDYDPATGRYVESDPIGLRGGTNTDGYTGSNPRVRIDPLGQRWVPCNDVSVGAMCWVPDPVVDRVPTCATAECAAGIPPNRPLRVDQDDFADFFGELSRQSKAAAAACSVSPTPQGAGGLIMFGALGLAADAAEQLLRPDVSKSVTQLAVEVGTIGIPPQVGAPAQLFISEYVRLNPEGAQRNETK
jgi:RHS repeat-associated protein